MSTTTAFDELAGIGSRRALATAGAVYVGAWLLGLATAPTAPKPDAADAAIQAFYADNGSAAMVQASLVHGMASVALAVFVVCLAGRLARDGADSRRVALLGAGLGAAAVSLAQLGMELGLNRASDGGGVSASGTLFDAVNVADTVKLVLLAVAIVAATHLLARPGWLRVLGFALAPVLVAGGAAFVVVSDALSAVLALSLMLLLVWVAAVSVVVSRVRPEGPATA
jgi:hypothetical protein